MRKIHIGEAVWEYTIGKGNVVIKSPAEKKVVVDFSTLTGICNNAIENMQDNKCFAVTPATIKTYIEQNLLETK